MKALVNFFVLVISCIGVLNAQTSYQLETCEMSVSGTSTLHDWESSVTEVQIEGKFMVSNNALTDIQNLTVSIPVKSIISTKGSIMDNKTWGALEAEKHPNITYRLNKVNSIETTAKGITLNLTGLLNIAGVNKSISLKVTGKMLNNGLMEFEGSKTLKMTDFEMKPPTALMGTIKTGDEITIKFKAKMNAAKS